MKNHSRSSSWGIALTLALSLTQAYALNAVDPATIKQNPRVSNRPEAGVMLAETRPEKLFYLTGQAVNGVVTLSNPFLQGRTVQVRAWLEQELDRKTGVQTQDVTVAANSAQTLTFTWPAREVASFGQTLVAEVVADGQVIATGRDAFGSADRVWDVAIGALPNGPAASSYGYTTEQITGQIRQFRDKYCNVWEKYFWAPDDWGLMVTEPGATWYSGQARRHETTENIKLQVETSHALGIAVATYGKCMAGGAHGWELARARPQWFLTDVNGRTMGRPGDVWDLDHWQEGDKHKYEEFKFIWTYRWVDMRRLDALDYGIDQLIASTKQFGWDGVRFDSGGFRAHFVDGVYGGNDAVNTRNMKRTKERLWDAVPGYLFGFNTENTTSRDGRAYPLTIGEMSHEMREMLAGGGLWMGEGIKNFANGGVTYTNWSQYAHDERRCAAAIRGAGGQFCYLFTHGAPVRNVYQFVIGLIIGAHPYGGEHISLAGSADWGALMTRWSGLLWDSRVRPLDADAASVTVSASRPLWWKEFVNERVVSADRRQVIVHLLNPPADDEIAKVLKELPKDVVALAKSADPAAARAKDDDSLGAVLAGTAPAVPSEVPQLAPAVLAAARAQQFPPPVRQGVVTVRVPAGQKPRVAWVIAPGTPDRASAAEWKLVDGNMVVTVPEFALWAIVVCEFEGAFVPSAPARFSEPLSPAEMADLQRQVPTPAKEIPSFDLRPPAPTPNVPVTDTVPEFVAAPGATPAREEPAAGNVPAGLAIGGVAGLDVLVVNGMYHKPYGVRAALQAVAPQARVSDCTTRDLPVTREAVFAYDVIVLVDMPASAWSPEGQRLLAEFVRAGGRLAVLGGPFTLGQGDFRTSPLAAVLPVELRSGRDVYALAKPLPLGPAARTAFPEQSVVYYAHAAKPRADATVRAWAGDWPVFVEGKFGRGATLVFLGTTLGERQGAETPFWDAKGWPVTLGRALVGP